MSQAPGALPAGLSMVYAGDPALFRYYRLLSKNRRNNLIPHYMIAATIGNYQQPAPPTDGVSPCNEYQPHSALNDPRD
ncbi:hypothetical protein B6N31_13410 [Dickeya fangzhongdai]|nr:hypothetical protein B6N31_13410 [Dickeya fangzhongdai]